MWASWKMVAEHLVRDTSSTKTAIPQTFCIRFGYPRSARLAALPGFDGNASANPPAGHLSATASLYLRFAASPPSRDTSGMIWTPGMILGYGSVTTPPSASVEQAAQTGWNIPVSTQFQKLTFAASARPYKHNVGSACRMHALLGWLHALDGWMAEWMHALLGWMHALLGWLHALDGWMAGWMHALLGWMHALLVRRTGYLIRLPNRQFSVREYTSKPALRRPCSSCTFSASGIGGARLASPSLPKCHSDWRQTA